MIKTQNKTTVDDRLQLKPHYRYVFKKYMAENYIKVPNGDVDAMFKKNPRKL